MTSSSEPTSDAIRTGDWEVWTVAQSGDEPSCRYRRDKPDALYLAGVVARASGEGGAVGVWVQHAESGDVIWSAGAVPSSKKVDGV